ncbi:HAD family hydrolase [Rhodobacteraceae bacterium RKSG542]|uniref:HAD-IA family hydrolase n=1 Tax=Pseudovibrio flavus TaxID=2529854 RepID=UPI0012BD06D1|nr:HAD-IA family hydrolase [Pseudovibrio flavus]MTI16423.1 HAD family hydrolase [Pseudovibrio flavus]
MYLIVFDCDGTLVDGQHSVLQGIEVGFEAVGLAAPDRDAVVDTIGLSLDHAIAQLAGPEHYDLVPQISEAFRREKLSRRALNLDYDPLYPGVVEVLQELAAMDNVLLGIATGKHMRGVKHMIDVHGLHNMFVTIQTADRAPSKPNPGMLLQAMGETGIEANNTVMVGDTTYDMLMARNAGVHGIGVSWGYHKRRELVRAGAGHVIDRFSTLVPTLKEVLDWAEEVA